MKFKTWNTMYVDVAAMCAFALLLLMAYFVGIQPVIQRYQGFGRMVEKLENQQHIEMELSGQVAKLAAGLTDVKQQLADNAIKLTPATQINSHLARLATLTGQCGLKLDQLRPDKSLDGPRYKTVPIYLVGSGDFPACARLLKKLQQDFPDTSVASFDMQGDPANPEAPTRLKVDLLWYALADKLISAR
ncbi:MAG: hypothetical protein HN350_16735 [Phycisphaerales bacterium]|jgi:Tfp pilus assembly protein PilO|nr:hypothetical protein [Phycisphaerales bacterium]